MDLDPRTWLRSVAKAAAWLALGLAGLLLWAPVGWIPPELAAWLGSRQRP